MSILKKAIMTCLMLIGLQTIHASPALRSSEALRSLTPRERKISQCMLMAALTAANSDYQYNDDWEVSEEEVQMMMLNVVVMMQKGALNDRFYAILGAVFEEMMKNHAE